MTTMHIRNVAFSTDGLDGVTPTRWLDWKKSEYIEREKRRSIGNRWVAPEHMKLGKYMRRYSDTKNLIMPEPDALRLQHRSDLRKQNILDNCSEGV